MPTQTPSGVRLGPEESTVHGFLVALAVLGSAACQSELGVTLTMIMTTCTSEQMGGGYSKVKRSKIVEKTKVALHVSESQGI